MRKSNSAMLHYELRTGNQDFWMESTRRLDAGCITDIGSSGDAAPLYWAVEEASVVAIERWPRASLEPR